MANQILYGFQNLATIFDRRITPELVPTVFDAIQQSATEHNRQMNALVSLFVERTTEFKRRYRTPSLNRLQPLDENGRARPVTPAGAYDVAWPIQAAGTAWGANRIARVKMTVQDANEITAMMFAGDFRWMRDHILAALFYDAGGDGTGWAYNDPNDDIGSLNILGLADGDTQSYNIMAGSDSRATDDHLLAQADAIADETNPFPGIYQDLTEHPDNSGEVVTIIPTNLKASVEGLATFYPMSDPNLRSGTGVTELAGSLGIQVPGEVIGYVDKNWIVEWRSMPDNYSVSVTTGGTRPLRMREHPEAELQGFKLVAMREDHPFEESQWERHAGFGAWNRVGAVVKRYGNGTYAVPTGYSSPLP
jgi:hypothetical protein